MTRFPGNTEKSANDLSERYCGCCLMKAIENCCVKTTLMNLKFNELPLMFKRTYFVFGHEELKARFSIDCMRVLTEGPYNYNPLQHDPKPRSLIPIFTNPSSLFIVNHHMTYLPADGPIYSTDFWWYASARMEKSITGFILLRHYQRVFF